jgi:hypothetical protein
MQKKQESFHKYWHDDVWVDQKVLKVTKYDYLSGKMALKPFTGDHPAIMRKRIEKMNWYFECNSSMQRTSTKERIKDLLRKFLGLNLDYTNYKIVNR